MPAQPPAATPAGWEATNYASFVRFLEGIAGGQSSARLVDLDGVTAAISPAVPERSLFNSVAYEDADSLAGALERLGAAYADAGIVAWTVWVPAADAASRSLLADRGHRLDGRPLAMRLELSELRAAGEEPASEAGSGGWRTLCEINDAAYPSISPGTYRAALGERPDPELRVYLADADGRPGAAVASVDHAGDCGIYCVATRPDCRRRGLAEGLMRRVLLAAAERGCETSSLQASMLGRGVYERIGYREVGTLEMWERRSAPG